MAILQLPTVNDGTPHYSFRTQLEGTDYVFDFRYGARRGCWMFDLSTLDGTEILRGQMVTVLRDLLARATGPDRPLGQLWAMNVKEPTAAEGGARALPGLLDLGASGRCRLYYTTSDTQAENEASGTEAPL